MYVFWVLFTCGLRGLILIFIVTWSPCIMIIGNWGKNLVMGDLFWRMWMKWLMNFWQKIIRVTLPCLALRKGNFFRCWFIRKLLVLFFCLLSVLVEYALEVLVIAALESVIRNVICCVLDNRWYLTEIWEDFGKDYFRIFFLIKFLLWFACFLFLIL